MTQSDLFKESIRVKECDMKVSNLLAFLDTMRAECNKQFEDSTFIYSLLRQFMLSGMSSTDRAKLDYAVLERDEDARNYKNDL